MDSLGARALNAYFRSGGTDLPSRHVEPVEHAKKRYAVLDNVSGVLAVYRIRRDGRLRRLRRWPAAVGAR